MVDFHSHCFNNRPADVDAGASFCEVLRRLCWIALPVVVVLTYAWLQNESFNTSYQQELVLRENQALDRRLSQLQVELSSLASPAKIAAAARERGFVRLDEGIEVIQAPAPQFRPDEVLMAQNRAPHSER